VEEEQEEVEAGVTEVQEEDRQLSTGKRGTHS
jgi:hypothetical protein